MITYEVTEHISSTKDSVNNKRIFIIEAESDQEAIEKFMASFDVSSYKKNIEWDIVLRKIETVSTDIFVINSVTYKNNK